MNELEDATDWVTYRTAYYSAQESARDAYCKSINADIVYDAAWADYNAAYASGIGIKAALDAARVVSREALNAARVARDAFKQAADAADNYDASSDTYEAEE